MNPEKQQRKLSQKNATIETQFPVKQSHVPSRTCCFGKVVEVEGKMSVFEFLVFFLTHFDTDTLGIVSTFQCVKQSK